MLIYYANIILNFKSVLWQTINIPCTNTIDTEKMLGKIMKKTLLIAGLSMLLLVAMAVPAMAELGDVGIQVGDWFRWEPSMTWEADEGVSPPWSAAYITWANDTDWVEYTATSVEDSTVNYTVVTHLSNGTEVPSTASANVTNSYDGNFGMLAISANLTEGTVVRTWGSPLALNASFMLTTDNGTRETNVLDYESTYSGHNVYMWDKEVGILIYRSVSASTATYNYTYTLELVNSSSGLISPDLTGPLLLLATMSITIPVALLHRRKKIAI
jgi:hypothetical protein